MIGQLFFVEIRLNPPLMRTQGTATNPCLIQVWPGSDQSLGHFSAYDAVRLDGATLHYPFSWDEGDGNGEPQLLAGSSEASNATNPKNIDLVLIVLS